MASREEYEKQLSWRLKQIDIGRSSKAYEDYAASITKFRRKREHPSTPDPYDARMSKRQFEGRVKAWKRAVHDLFPTHSTSERVSEVDTFTLFLRKDELERVKIPNASYVRVVLIDAASM